LLRRERELTRRNVNLALINELASTLTSSTDIDEILEQALTRMMNNLDLAVVEVYLRQGQSDRLNWCITAARWCPHCGIKRNLCWAKAWWAKLPNWGSRTRCNCPIKIIKISTRLFWSATAGRWPVSR
jgi:nitrate/nitrite-specific signal transduction histidine kinase